MTALPEEDLDDLLGQTVRLANEVARGRLAVDDQHVVALMDRIATAGRHTTDAEQRSALNRMLSHWQDVLLDLSFEASARVPDLFEPDPTEDDDLLINASIGASLMALADQARLDWERNRRHPRPLVNYRTISSVGATPRDGSFVTSLRGIEFIDCGFEGISFEGLDLSAVRMTRCELKNCVLATSPPVDRWADVTFADCRFVGCSFIGANFTVSGFSECVFLSSTNLPAQLDRVTFNRCSLSRLRADNGLIVEDCNLTASLIIQSEFNYLQFKSCDLSGTLMHGCTIRSPYETLFTNCDLSRARFIGQDCSNWQFSTCQFPGTIWVEATLNGIVFQNATWGNLDELIIRDCAGALPLPFREGADDHPR